MGRKHDRDEEIVDRLERENRELKALNRSLMRRLKKVDKAYRAKQELVEAEEEKVSRREDERAEEKKIGNCPKCRENDLKEINLGRKVYMTCKCGYRQAVKNG